MVSNTEATIGMHPLLPLPPILDSLNPDPGPHPWWVGAPADLALLRPWLMPLFILH